MSENKNSNKFFLFSFLPAIAYWYLETKYPIKIAIAGGLLLAILEISAEKIFFKHVHKLSKFNFFLLLFLGGLSLLGEDGLWFKLQPFFTGQVLGGVLIFYLWKGKGLMAEMMESMGKKSDPCPFVSKTRMAYGHSYDGIWSVYGRYCSLDPDLYLGVL